MNRPVYYTIAPVFARQTQDGQGFFGASQAAGKTTGLTSTAPITKRVARWPRSAEVGARLCALLLFSALMVSCAPVAGGGSQSGSVRPAPQLNDVPDRPEGLPTQEELAELRRRLEADRDEALGGPAEEPPMPPLPEPLPELTETMEELPVERPPIGLVDAGRSGVSVQVATVRFPGDSTELDPEMIDVLSQVAREQQAIGGTVRVVGHGGQTSSEDLAHRQLAEIGQTLVRMGVPPTRIGTELAASGGGDPGDHGRAVIYLDY